MASNDATKVVIKSKDELEERHRIELESNEATFQATIKDAVNKKRAKTAVKKERDILVDRHYNEKNEFLLSADDQIILERLTLSDDQKAEKPKVVEAGECEFNFNFLQNNFKLFIKKIEFLNFTRLWKLFILVTEPEPEQKMSKAAKRRLKKLEEQKAADERIAAALKESNDKISRGELTPRVEESQKIQEISPQV